MNKKTLTAVVVAMAMMLLGEKFLKIRQNISKHELEYTPEEKDRIGKLEGKCAGYMAKGMKEGVFDKVKAFGNELKGILKGILNAVTE